MHARGPLTWLPVRHYNAAGHWRRVRLVGQQKTLHLARLLHVARERHGRHERVRVALVLRKSARPPGRHDHCNERDTAVAPCLGEQWHLNHFINGSSRVHVLARPERIAQFRAHSPRIRDLAGHCVEAHHEAVL